jgi:hydrogenase maturation factor
MSQIVQQHPVLGPITPLGAACEPDAHGRCLTCSDEALPATVLQIDEEHWTAVVQVENQITEIDISLVDDVTTGMVLLVHGGVALGRLEIG